MLRPLVAWLRAVSPPAWAVLVFLFMYGLVEGMYLWVEQAFGVRDPEMLKVRDTIVLAAVVGYGLFRVAAFHPWYRKDYRGWLEQTCWSVIKPLPLGPVHLAVQDVLAVALLTFLLGDGPVSRHFAPFAFLLAYLGGLVLSTWMVGLVWTSFVLAAGLGLAVLLAKEGGFSLAWLAILYPIALAGLRGSLALFPWDTGQPAYQTDLVLESPQERQQRTLGWPFDYLDPRRHDYRIGYRDAILISLLAGWWAYVLGFHLPMPARPNVPLIAFMAALSIAFPGRLIRYCLAYWPPISLWGRICTGRWIIPRYDQVFVAPFTALVVGAALSGLLIGLRLPQDAALSISVSAVLIIALTMGPSLSEWQLTGLHRMNPVLFKNTELIEL